MGTYRVLWQPRLAAERPARGAILKRPPAGEHWEACVREARDHKLWLMHWLVS